MLAGGCYTVNFVSFNIGVQVSAPRWVSARAVATYQTCVSAGLALGGLMWGLVAAHIGVGPALFACGLTMLAMPVWMTIAAIVLSLPLMLVGLRVLGETNWGPISALSNMMQGVFAALAPGNVAANMVASGTTGTIATSSESIMQDYRCGQIIGTKPRNLTIMQLLAVPVGSRLELGLDGGFVGYSVIPSVRVRLAGEALALHAVAAMPISFNDGSTMQTFVAGGFGAGVRYQPAPSFAMRLEGYAAYAGKAHGWSIPTFLGGELWF